MRVESGDEGISDARVAQLHIANVVADLPADELGRAEVIENFFKVAGVERAEKLFVVRCQRSDVIQRIVGEPYRDRATLAPFPSSRDGHLCSSSDLVPIFQPKGTHHQHSA